MAGPWDNDVALQDIPRPEQADAQEIKTGPWEKDFALFRKTLRELFTATPEVTPEGGAMIEAPEQPVAPEPMAPMAEMPAPEQRFEMQVGTTQPQAPAFEPILEEEGVTPTPVPRPELRFDTVPEDRRRVLELNLPENVQQDTAFLDKVNEVSSNLGISSDDLLRVIQFETAGSFSPSQKAGTSNAMGLIQFIPSTAKDLGTSTKELAAMTRVEQMAFVEKYLSRFKGKMEDFGDLYMAVHWPRAVGKDDDYVMYRKGSKAYAANKGLDIDKDGDVEKIEAVTKAIGD